MIPLITNIALPIIKELMGKGLTSLAGAVANKGQDYIESKLGITLNGEINDDKALALREVEIEHAEFLTNAALEGRRLDLEEVRLADTNTADAREHDVEIQKTENTTQFVKEAAYYLDFIIILATLFVAGMMVFYEIPPSNKELAYMALGALLAHCGTILNFHRGSSARSQTKDQTIANLVGGSK